MSIPKLIETLYEQKRWPELMFYFRAQWNNSAWAASKRNGNAVDRIKREFSRLAKGKQPYKLGTHSQYWDQQIAKYIDRLGVASLINDMREAFQKFPQIKTIIYFLYSSTGNSRWENLIYTKIEHDWQQEKQLEANQWQPFAQMLNFAKSEPDWVAQSRNEIIRLIQKSKLPDINPREINNEIHKIKNKLSALGYQI